MLIVSVYMCRRVGKPEAGHCVECWTMSLWVPVSAGSPVPGPGFELLGSHLSVAYVQVVGNERGERKSQWSKIFKSNTHQPDGAFVHGVLYTERKVHLSNCLRDDHPHFLKADS